MKRFLGLLVVAVLAAILLAPAGSASHREGESGPQRDFVRGKAASNLIGKTRFKAREARPGQEVEGTFRAKGGLIGPAPLVPFELKGPISCLEVDGNEASLFYPVEEGDPTFTEGTGIFIFLQDNGRRRDGDPPDQMGFLGPLPIPDLGVCPVFPGPLDTLLPLDRGGISVHDAG